MTETPCAETYPDRGPCVRTAGHSGDHEDAQGRTWTRADGVWARR